MNIIGKALISIANIKGIIPLTHSIPIFCSTFAAAINILINGLLGFFNFRVKAKNMGFALIVQKAFIINNNDISEGMHIFDSVRLHLYFTCVLFQPPWNLTASIFPSSRNLIILNSHFWNSSKKDQK